MKTTILKLGEMTVNGILYPESLEVSLADEEIPVTIDYKPDKIIGVAKDFEKEDDKLVADIVLEEDIELGEDIVFRPAFVINEEIEKEDVGRAITEIEIVEVTALDEIEDAFEEDEEDEDEKDDEDDE